jgi:hypothetical protein
MTDATGIPPVTPLTGGNRNDITQLIPLLEAVPAVRSKRDRPLRRPDAVRGAPTLREDAVCPQGTRKGEERTHSSPL